MKSCKAVLREPKDSHTMIDVISGTFNRICANGFGSKEEQYETPFTYIDRDVADARKITGVRQTEGSSSPTFIDTMHDSAMRLLYGPPIDYEEVQDSSYDRPCVRDYGIQIKLTKSLQLKKKQERFRAHLDRIDEVLAIAKDGNEDQKKEPKDEEEIIDEGNNHSEVMENIKDIKEEVASEVIASNIQVNRHSDNSRDHYGEDAESNKARVVGDKEKSLETHSLENEEHLKMSSGLPEEDSESDLSEDDSDNDSDEVLHGQCLGDQHKIMRQNETMYEEDSDEMNKIQLDTGDSDKKLQYEENLNAGLKSMHQEGGMLNKMQYNNLDCKKYNKMSKEENADSVEMREYTPGNSVRRRQFHCQALMKLSRQIENMGMEAKKKLQEMESSRQRNSCLEANGMDSMKIYAQNMIGELTRNTTHKMSKIDSVEMRDFRFKYSVNESQKQCEVKRRQMVTHPFQQETIPEDDECILKPGNCLAGQASNNRQENRLQYNSKKVTVHQQNYEDFKYLKTKSRGIEYVPDSSENFGDFANNEPVAETTGRNQLLNYTDLINNLAREHDRRRNQDTENVWKSVLFQERNLESVALPDVVRHNKQENFYHPNEIGAEIAATRGFNSNYTDFVNNESVSEMTGRHQVLNYADLANNQARDFEMRRDQDSDNVWNYVLFQERNLDLLPEVVNDNNQENFIHPMLAAARGFNLNYIDFGNNESVWEMTGRNQLLNYDDLVNNLLRERERQRNQLSGSIWNYGLFQEGNEDIGKRNINDFSVEDFQENCNVNRSPISDVSLEHYIMNYIMPICRFKIP